VTPKASSATVLARPGWCVTHEELAWRYSDGGISCWYCCIVETSPESAGCVVVPAIVTVRGKRMVLREDRG